MSRITKTAQDYWADKSDFFSKYYKKPSLFDRIFRKGVYERLSLTVKACLDVQNASVLDVGSGPGLNSISMLKKGGALHVTGIDFAREMVDYANEAARSEGVADWCNFILGDAINHDFEDKKFDFSMALGVFDYIEDAQTLIRRMSELTTNTFVISWPENGLRMWLRRQRYSCPLYHYTLTDIRDLHAKVSIGSDKLEIIRIGGGWVTIARK